MIDKNTLLNPEFRGKSLRPGNVWETAELPALMKNPNIERVITIDPVTNIETEIFTRINK